MKRIATFKKVPFEQFKNDYLDLVNHVASDKEILDIYNDIKLPVRATEGSAGYDFFAPKEIILTEKDSVTIPTGICVEMVEPGWVLSIYPRSGLGFKYRAALDNTVGIIDSDYYFSDNHGHIIVKIHKGKHPSQITVEKGKGFAQGIFTEFGITTDDVATTKLNGGFGSTSKT